MSGRLRKKKIIKPDYRKLKLYLNKYHKFSFKMPRGKKDFTPQQKSAITRIYRKYYSQITLVEDEIKSFIPYPKKSKLKDVDGVRTNKGIFYKYPGATAEKLPKKKNQKNQYFQIQLNYKKQREIFIPFPVEIWDDIEEIREFVRIKAKKYKPDYILWSVYGSRGSQLYEPDVFEFYANTVELYINDKTGQIETSFNGVFFGWYPSDWGVKKKHATKETTNKNSRH